MLSERTGLKQEVGSLQIGCGEGKVSGDMLRLPEVKLTSYTRKTIVTDVNVTIPVHVCWNSTRS